MNASVNGMRVKAPMNKPHQNPVHCEQSRSFFKNKDLCFIQFLGVLRISEY